MLLGVTYSMVSSLQTGWLGNLNRLLWKAIPVDGVHGTFYHGNWRALHHHAAC